MHLDGFFCGFSLEPIEITQIVRVSCCYSNVLSYKVPIIMLTKSSDMLNKNTWGVKKVRGQEEPATKSSDIK